MPGEAPWKGPETSEEALSKFNRSIQLKLFTGESLMYVAMNFVSWSASCVLAYFIEKSPFGLAFQK